MASRIRKITGFKKEIYHSRSEWTGEDWIGEARFEKCLLDAMAKVDRKCNDSVIQVAKDWQNYKSLYDSLKAEK